MLGDWAKQLASSTSKLLILGLIEVKCSDPTRMDQVSVLKCHPWIGMLTHTVLDGFITEVNHMYKVT